MGALHLITLGNVEVFVCVFAVLSMGQLFCAGYCGARVFGASVGPSLLFVRFVRRASTMEGWEAFLCVYTLSCITVACAGRLVFWVWQGVHIMQFQHCNNKIEPAV